MSPVDPKSLEAFAERVEFAGDPTCAKCGYSLAGLPVGSRCPECGTPTRRRRSPRRFADSLTDAPAGYLRTLSLGFVLMSLAGAAGVAFFGVGFVSPAGGALAALAGVVWWTGVFIVTGPRRVTAQTEIDPAAENRWLRWVNRLTQAAWIGAGLLEGALCASLGGLRGMRAAPLGVADAWLFFGMAGCIAIGLVGLGPLSAQLSDLADWANESTLAARLRAIALVVTGCGGYIVVAVSVIVATGKVTALATLHGALGLPLFVAWPLMVGTLLIFFFTLFQMSQMTGWALSNASSASDRDLRLREKYERARARADAARAAGYQVDPPRDVRAP